MDMRCRVLTMQQLQGLDDLQQEARPGSGDDGYWAHTRHQVYRADVDAALEPNQLAQEHPIEWIMIQGLA